MSLSSSSITALSAALSTVALLTILQQINLETTKTKDKEYQSTTTQLGPWSPTDRNQSKIPSGPQITARLIDKFCGINDVYLSRVPHGQVGSACWSILLGTIHQQALPVSSSAAEPKTVAVKSLPNWSHLQLAPLVKHESELCVKISRATLMTLFALTNARPIYRYSSAAGHRSACSSYCGQWTISWPIGKPCVVRLAPHDSHAAASDVYPPSFPARVDKCVEMMAGIITDGDAWKVAFPGRAKHSGPWLLQERVKGFGAAHGARHLYNMQGGKVFEVDLLALVPTLEEQKEALLLEIPSLEESGRNATLYVPKHEEQILAKALDCLPWSSLSWSLHRGMRDILLAYGKPLMNECRAHLASGIRAAVLPNRLLLIQKGWAAELVDGPMASMAESAILSGSGNSGDVIRIVVAIMECILQNFDAVIWEKLDLDKTSFWTKQLGDSNTSMLSIHFTSEHFDARSMDMMVALIKYFVLEWSQELDYQLYHDLPVDILLA